VILEDTRGIRNEKQISRLFLTALMHIPAFGLEFSNAGPNGLDNSTRSLGTWPIPPPDGPP